MGMIKRRSFKPGSVVSKTSEQIHKTRILTPTHEEYCLHFDLLGKKRTESATNRIRKQLEEFVPLQTEKHWVLNDVLGKCKVQGSRLAILIWLLRNTLFTDLKDTAGLYNLVDLNAPQNNPAPISDNLPPEKVTEKPKTRKPRAKKVVETTDTPAEIKPKRTRKKKEVENGGKS